MFKFNKLYLTTAIIFCVGVLCVLFNTLSTYLNLIALVIFAIGFSFLAVCFLKNYLNYKKEGLKYNSEIVMEQGGRIVENGVEYVYVQNNSYEQKMKKEVAKEKFKKIWPVAFSFLMTAVMLTLFVLQLF